ENLPYGVVRPPGEGARVTVRIGDYALDLAAVADAGLLQATAPGVFTQPTLNAFLELGQDTWTRTRARLTELLSSGNDEIRAAGLAQRALIPLERCECLLPVAVADYVDFFSSIEHASNAGRIFRPDAEPLPPNWRWLPVGYHGRAATVVVSGTPIRRPCGQ